MIVSAIDSYYSWVKAQMAVLGAQALVNGSLVAQPMGGISNAQDWPLAPVDEAELQLLVLNTLPTNRSTQGQTEYEYQVQWVWILLGTDIGTGERKFNRGDRYRAGMMIMENLRQAHVPGFCRKSDYSVNTSTGVLSMVAAASTEPYSAIEMVRWTSPRFMPKTGQKDTGVDYNAAAVELFAYSDMALAVV